MSITSEMTSKVSKPSKLLLNGIFAVFKEKGDSVLDYKTWIRLTHFNENNLGPFEKRWTAPSIILDIMPRFVEPFATGILCVGIGLWATKSIGLTPFWPHEWLINAKFGTQTQHYCIDSPVVQQKPYGHITEDNLRNQLKTFIGDIGQLTPPYIMTESILPHKEKLRPKVEPVVKMEPLLRVRQCHSIELLEFDPPNIKLKVLSDGFFSCRAFINDLGLKLDSCAHITGLQLNRMGVITTEDCLKKYELHSSRITEAIEKYSNFISKDLKQFEDLKTITRRVV